MRLKLNAIFECTFPDEKALKQTNDLAKHNTEDMMNKYKFYKTCKCSFSTRTSYSLLFQFQRISSLTLMTNIHSLTLFSDQKLLNFRKRFSRLSLYGLSPNFASSIKQIWAKLTSIPPEIIRKPMVFCWFQGE